MQLRAISVAILVLLAGCATKEGYQETVESWVGSPETELIGQWGLPDKAYIVDATTKYVTYQRSRSYRVEGTPASYQTTHSGGGVYTTAQVGGSDSVTLKRQCETTFKIVSGKVASWQFKGNGCKG